MERTYYSLDEAAARAAHNANSMRPFRSDESDYRTEVDEAYELADLAAERNPERAADAYGVADRYAQLLAAWYNKRYRIEGMCPSMLVSGGGNFPVKKKARQNAARDAHMDEYAKIKRLLEKIRRIGTGADIIKSGDQNAIEKLRLKIELLEERQESMKRINAEARKGGEVAPFPSWMLANNRQNIAAARNRLELLEDEKERGTGERETVINGEPCRVVENVELMRLQLVFDDKPSDEVRSALKRHGFRWSQTNGAWQRQLTGNARYALQRIIGKE